MIIDNRYWAGFFDGEGNIHVAPDVRHMAVSITQKEPAVLFLIQKQFGGKIKKYGKQTCHKWRIHSAGEAEAFLKAIAPYVVVKAVEVQVCLEMLKGWGRGRGYQPPMTDEEESRRLTLRDSLMKDRADDKQVSEIMSRER